jgi:phosphate/sulfate permease
MNKSFTKSYSFTIIVSVIGLTLSVASLLYYLAMTKGIVPREVLLSAIGGIVGFLGSALFYWFIERKAHKAVAVFISYGLEHKRIAERLERSLVKDGFQVFDMPSSIRVGESISSRLEETLGKSNYLIVLMPESTAMSQMVEQELNYALTQNIKVLPVLVGDKTQLPPMLADIKPVSIKESYDTAYDELRSALAVRAKD